MAQTKSFSPERHLARGSKDARRCNSAGRVISWRKSKKEFQSPSESRRDRGSPAVVLHAWSGDRAEEPEGPDLPMPSIIIISIFVALPLSGIRTAMLAGRRGGEAGRPVATAWALSCGNRPMATGGNRRQQAATKLTSGMVPGALLID